MAIFSQNLLSLKEVPKPETFIMFKVEKVAKDCSKSNVAKQLVAKPIK